jgi:hypothetical protein
MKVICKTNISPISDIVFNITPGKIYEVRTTLFPWVYIIDDSGAKEHYHEDMHTALIELRNEKLEEILK